MDFTNAPLEPRVMQFPRPEPMILGPLALRALLLRTAAIAKAYRHLPTPPLDPTGWWAQPVGATS